MAMQVFQLQRELLQERTKVKALSEELENPMNVHRWRKLEGSDPATFEMLQKVKTLQKRLISKTEEAVEKHSGEKRKRESSEEEKEEPVKKKITLTTLMSKPGELKVKDEGMMEDVGECECCWAKDEG